MCIYVLMFTSVGVGHKPKVDVGCLPPSFSTFTEAGFLFEPRACQFLASPRESICLYLRRAEITGGHHASPAFPAVGSGEPNSRHRLVRQMLYPLSHLPVPPPLCFIRVSYKILGEGFFTET